MRVLYLQPSGVFGGSPKSLIELFRCLAKSSVKATVLTPSGSAADAFAAVGMDVRRVKGLSQFDNTRYGYYRGTRWLILLRELFFLPFSLVAVWNLRREDFDLIHANEVTLLPLAVIAKLVLGAPLVVHVRSLQRCSEGNRRGAWINRLLERHADAVVAIDQSVAATLGKEVAKSIVHNGLDISPSEATSPAVGSSAIRAVKAGFVGVLLPLKGIYKLVEAMRILKEREVTIELVVAGENSRALSGAKAWVLQKLGFYRDVRSDLAALVEKYGLTDRVKFVGFVGDVRTLYPKIDILCFPSHLDAAGRPVFEAAFYGIPSVVAVADPPTDAIVHNVTGLAIPRPDPVLIADALQRLAEDEEFRLQLGRQAREWAREKFSIEKSADAIFDIYSNLQSRRPGHTSSAGRPALSVGH
jgi:glycosyltransferase involved in cell wall biosynthesis